MSARIANGPSPLAKYSLRFAACRDLGHSWMFARWDGSEREVVCANCGTRRHDTLEAWRVVKRRYSYAKGYQISSELEIDVAVEARRLLARLAESKSIRWAREGRRVLSSVS